MKSANRLLHYLANPFPKQKSFGPYASPGRVVHVPILIMLTVLGWLLLGWHPSGRWLVVVYVVAGIYLGRDLAIAAHYFFLITLITLALPLAALTVLLPMIRKLTTTIREDELLWPGVVVAVSLLVVMVVRIYLMTMPEQERTEVDL